MAKKISVELTDDINPDLTADETIEFALDGTSYTIDLNSKNCDKFRKVMQPWIGAARKSSGARKTRTGTRIPSDQIQAMREWATNNGYKVSTKGRIPNAVAQAYHNRNAVAPVEFKAAK